MRPALRRFSACVAVARATASPNAHAQTDCSRYVDPFIGSAGSGNVVVGPSAPFGMVKPGPDCSRYANSGYEPDQTVPVQGFSQVHVSGTGGGAKYGNVSVMPFVGDADTLKLDSLRQEEKATLGYYSVLLQRWNVRAELTASPRVAFYRFGLPATDVGKRSVKLDATDFLNESTDYPEREGQYFVGSETEIVSEHLPGIDYALALAAKRKDADVPPGGNEEQEGRGGLPGYNTLGYVSTRYPRSGTRKVEYSYDDFCLATVAKGLGDDALSGRFARQAGNWRNPWREDFADHGTTGFVMPRDADGKWVDFVKPTVKGMENEVVPYVPTYSNIGRHEDWWAGFVYEGRAWEYSLSVPHDVAGLIALAGGPDAFQTRLDTLFDNRYYHVGNEPSFLSPTLYHRIGRPELSSERIHAIIDQAYSDQPKGLPGNDDSGAMSSWLAFHMPGLYPNAGQSYYLLNTPFFTASTLHLADGKTLQITAKNLSAENRCITAARLNGQPLRRAWIEHAEIVAGGVLELDLAAKPTGWGREELPPSLRH